MASTINKVILVGNTGKDPEIRATQDGREIANLTIATSEIWKDKISGENKEKTEWHKVVIFPEGLVKIVKNYVKKGTKLYIEGALQTRKWTDTQGMERYITEIVVQGFQGTLKILTSTNESNSSNNNNNNKTNDSSDYQNFSEIDDIDEIPF